MSPIEKPFIDNKILEKIQSDFFNDFDLANTVNDFINDPFGTYSENKYKKAIGAIFFYTNQVQRKLCNDINFRQVGALADGTVFIDTFKKNNTYNDFLNKNINENHMSRRTFRNAIQYGIGFGVGFSSTTRRLCSRRTFRWGGSEEVPLGALASSMEYP